MTNQLMNKSTDIEHEVAKLIRDRRSRRAYDSRPVEDEKIRSLFEAARWAPSSSNEQPWKYVYATHQQPLWQQLFDCLFDGNKLWAKDAPVLILSLARRHFVRNQQPNGYATYDLGAANAFMSLEAVDLGLQLRQMGGYDHARVRAELNIPDDYVLGAMIAVGYPGDLNSLPDFLREREISQRERTVQQEFVMNEKFEP